MIKTTPIIEADGTRRGGEDNTEKRFVLYTEREGYSNIINSFDSITEAKKYARILIDKYERNMERTQGPMEETPVGEGEDLFISDKDKNLRYYYDFENETWKRMK